MAAIALIASSRVDAQSAIDPPALPGALAPKLTTGNDGSLLLSWLEPVADQIEQKGAGRPLRLRFSQFDGAKWSEPRTIVQREDFFANWADVPSIIQAKDGSLLAHWLQKSGADTYSYDVMLARSTDAGKTWKELGRLHDDDTKTEHGFVSLLPEGDGVRAFWLDGREMKPPGEGEDDHGHGGGNMTLRTALIEGDAIGPSALLDMRVCECCNTSAALAEHGPIIVYRDRTEQETRDISLVRRVDGRWTNPKPVHEDDWVIPGCPVNGPAIAARRNDVAVAWFTAAQKPTVLIAFSSDGGATFNESILIDDNEPFGRAAIAMDGKGAAIVCWMASAETGAAFRTVRIKPDGTRGEVKTIAQTSASRSAGFPTIALSGDRLLVVWTDSGRPSHLRASLVQP